MRPARRFAALALALLAGAGCGSTPPSRFFVLSAVELGGAPGPPAEGAPRIHLEMVELPGYLALPELTARSGANRLELSLTDRWAEPLRDGIARVLVLDLAARLGPANVTRYPWERPAGPDAALLSVAVERFEPDGDHAVLAARWSFAGGRAGEHAGTWTQPLAGPGSADVARALSALLDQLAAAIAGS